MNTFNSRVFFWAMGASLAIVVAVLAEPVFAQSTAVTRVEEDWELVIGTPSTNSDAPQVTCLISPLPNADSYHATFVVNNHDMPTFVAGGLQLQVWNGKTLLASKRAQSGFACHPGAKQFAGPKCLERPATDWSSRSSTELRPPGAISATTER